jgi:ABC-type multidrug transport system fused ATPase/permease subunit
LRYAKESGSLFQWIIVLILFIGCEVIFSVYVSELANLYGNSINGTAWAKVLCLSFSLIIIYFLKYLYLVYVLIKANLSLHNKVYEKLLGGTVSFFENTYRSDLISRFSNDISIMDTSLPLIFCDSIESVLYFLNLVIVIAIKVKWWAPSIPFMFIVIGVIYKKCSPILQKSKLLDLKMKAPVIESFTDLIKGATQTRCFRL